MNVVSVDDIRAPHFDIEGEEIIRDNGYVYIRYSATEVACYDESVVITIEDRS